MQRNKLLIVIMVLFALSWSSAANAQTNLLRDPGFEGDQYKNVAIDPADSNTRFNVPVDWEGWFTLAPHSADWMNIYPNGFPQIGWPRRGGNRAINISRGQATFTVALYQRVTVTNGSNVQGGAFVYSENPAGTARAGIDPNGGTNPYDTDIVWGNWVNGPNSNFFETTVSATATGDAVTLFLFATQSQPSDPNGVYWDDAYLTVGGSGGSVSTPGGTPISGVPVVPTTAPPAVAGFVQPQPPQADGSIVHTVQPGDTLAAIAFAYGVPLDQLQTQNNISNPRILTVGQQIIIQPATDEGGSNNTTSDDEDPPASDDTDNSGDTGNEASQDEPTARPTNPPVLSSPTPAATAPVRQVAEGGVDPLATDSSVCVVLFEDSDQNRLQEEGEDLLADGEITLTSDGQILEEETTDDNETPCFDGLAAGDYVVAASAPGGYGLTTTDQLRVTLLAGETLYVAFGAAEGIEIAAAPTADSQTVTQSEDNTPPVVETTTDDSALNLIVDNSGLIVFGLAGLVMVVGLGVTIFGLTRRH
jgi:LysM repeat protein